MAAHRKNGAMKIQIFLKWRYDMPLQVLKTLSSIAFVL
ncbi:uncharacterized protein G2W53_021227 [Senna tora]|uniref:Uncharacterized protein n=1 Tax=Senna tora TaxID=362788 RepID=A0A834WJD1_9FABA|nr:uncharacterized protein G2W53_021227 [Senna tora]